MRTASMILLALIFACRVPTVAAQVTDTAIQSLPHSPYVVLRGQLNLPNDGIWEIRSASDEAIVQLYRLPPPQVDARQMGHRMQAAVRDRRIDQGRWKVAGLHWACVNYARAHNGLGPATVQQLEGDQNARYLIESLPRSPWSELQDADGKDIEGPFVFLVPQARFEFASAEGQQIATDRRTVLAIELRPYVDDGKHWVLYTDGTCQREAIRQDLVTAHGLQIRPIYKPSDLQAGAPAEIVPYILVAVRRDAAQKAKAFDVVVRNAISGEQQTHRWDPANARDRQDVLATLAAARAEAWQPYLRTGPAPVLRSWSALGTGAEPAEASEPRPGDNLSMYGLLGGRAAVEETLQMQVLRPSQPVDSDETVDISSLPGVQVKAHPYHEMLAGKPGGELKLAEAVPADRFFVYVAKPQAILPFLDHGTRFMAITGAALSGNRLDYNLTERYLQRLGVTRAQLEAVLRSGMVQDLAIVLPDLFVIDGTDMTVVVRLNQPQLVGGLLALLGAGRLAETPVLEINTPDGHAAHWALRGDLLCISSHRAELQCVLDQIKSQGAGSLGRSDEFRYMLTQLPVTDATRVYAYFSDPFVRRLVGPEVKLSQARRVRVRARMEYMTAQVLRARLDGVSTGSLKELQSSGYFPAGFVTDGYTLTPELQIRSDVYGTLALSRTLRDVPLEQVTKEEAESYQRYVTQYSQYWRQFFDPIAVRLADTADRKLELTTFILPLIDSSIYNGLRQTILHAEDSRSLVVPQLEPSPVLQFSANLSDVAWEQVARGFSEIFERFAHVSPAVLDDLGPSVHLAVHDADPVIALGSGDLLGAFGSNSLRSQGASMMIIPVVASVLTRPCTVLIETKDASNTARLLRQAASGWRTPTQSLGPDFRVSFYQVDDRDSWVWTMDLGGVVKLRLGIEVVDRYLVLRNIPWTASDRVVSTEKAGQNGALLTLRPAACRLQLPGLFATAADQEREAVMAGLGRLYPLTINGTTDPAAAAQQHQLLFGFRPVPPPQDQWLWQDFELSSSVYGSPKRQRQPGYDPQRPFGLLHDVQQLQLNMQLEDSGLRSTIVWKYEP